MPASFDWMNVEPPSAHRATLPGKRDAMLRTELEQRAALLYRLGQSAEYAKMRLRANLVWEYERNPPVPLLDVVDDIVAAVWQRGGPPSL